MEHYEYDHIPTPPAPSFLPSSAPKEKKSGIWIFVVLAFVFSLVGGALGASATYWLLNEQKDESVELSGNNKQETTQIQISNRPEIEQVPVENGESMTPAQVYTQNVNSTVGITTSVTTNYWGYQTTSAASGSGFIITNDGYILTNYHVIEGSSSITVNLYDGNSYEADLIGYDSSNDIAVIKVDAENLTPVIIGNSDNLHVGDNVVAIGNPLGELTFSLSMGVISAMDRRVTMSTGGTMNLLQTDCTINSGNSGGALFNLYGEVVGITNAKYSNNGNSTQAAIEGIGFAIPIDDVMPIVESIIEKGYFAKPYIGISVIDVSTETQGYGLPQGAAVQSVTEGSPAENGGLQQNDIITQVDGKAISGSSDLVEIVGSKEIGDTLELTVYRKGQTLTLTITVGEQIQSTNPDVHESTQTPVRPR